MTGSQIFISYRRGPSSTPYARGVYERAVQRFGEERVFMDLDSMEPGVDFVDYIHNALASCAVLIAVIGPDWLTVADARGRRRLDSPDDFVRAEIGAALAREDVRVIPVRVGAAPMPAREDLPDPLAALARRNAIDLSDERWAYDVGRLLDVVGKVVEAPRSPPPAPEAPPAAAQAGPPRGERVLTADAGSFAQHVARLATHASADASRPQLCGIHLDGELAVATDGFRLLCVSPGFDYDRPQALTLPAAELVAIVGEWGAHPRGKVALYRDDDHATLVYGDAQWPLRLVEGQYPNVRTLVPDESSLTVEARVAGDALAAVANAAVELPHLNRPLRLNFGSRGLTLRLQDEATGKALLAEVLPADVRELNGVTGALPMEAGYGAAYLADAVAVLDHRQLRLRCATPLRPLLLDAPEHTADYVLLMPIRLA